MNVRSIVIGAGLVLAGCGSETTLRVHVDLTGFSIPDQVDLLFLELTADPAGTIGRSFPLEAGQDRPVVDIVDGPRTPNGFALVAYAFKQNERVGQSASQHVRFVPDEVTRIDVSIPNGAAP